MLDEGFTTKVYIIYGGAVFVAVAAAGFLLAWAVL